MLFSLIAAGLSYWIYQGAKYHGISVDTSQKEYDLLYKRQATCRDFEFNEQESEADDYTQIKPENCKCRSSLFVYHLINFY